jgi:hypothetical protein
VKRFILLYYGFLKPTAEIMKDWGVWFESIADRTVENVGFGGGRKIYVEGVSGPPDGRGIAHWLQPYLSPEP